jgi:hypothetical protein
MREDINNSHNSYHPWLTFYRCGYQEKTVTWKIDGKRFASFYILQTLIAFELNALKVAP